MSGRHMVGGLKAHLALHGGEPGVCCSCRSHSTARRQGLIHRKPRAGLLQPSSPCQQVGFRGAHASANLMSSNHQSYRNRACRRGSSSTNMWTTRHVSGHGMRSAYSAVAPSTQRASRSSLQSHYDTRHCIQSLDGYTCRSRVAINWTH